MTPRRRALLFAALALSIVVAAVVARGRLRRGRGAGEVAVELIYDVQPERAAEAAFLAALDQLVARLRDGGLRIGAVLPQPRSAALTVPGLDEARLAAALAGLPLQAAPMEGGVASVRLRDDETARVADEALRKTAIALRERVLAAHPCDRCTPAVVTQGTWSQARLLVRLPWIDDATERRVRAAVSAPPPLPAPLSFARSRVVTPDRAGSFGEPRE